MQQKKVTSRARANSLSLRRRPKNEPKEEKEKLSLLVLPNVDHEDLVIEKLLLHGIGEDQILDGYYHMDLLADVKHPSMHSEALGEDDIPEDELGKFIRTQDEVDILKSFEEEGKYSLPLSDESESSSAPSPSAAHRARTLPSSGSTAPGR